MDADNWAGLDGEMTTLPTHYGRTKVTTVFRDFNRLRVAIRSHDTAAIEAAWLDCERWLDFVFGVVGWRERGKE